MIAPGRECLVCGAALGEGAFSLRRICSTACKKQRDETLRIEHRRKFRILCCLMCRDEYERAWPLQMWSVHRKGNRWGKNTRFAISYCKSCEPDFRDSLRSCAKCGDQFQPKTSNSWKCAPCVASGRSPEVKRCVVCDASFHPLSGTTGKFCSHRCSTTKNPHKFLRSMRCMMCAVEFKYHPRGYMRRYCSKQCQLDASHIRRAFSGWGVHDMPEPVRVVAVQMRQARKETQAVWRTK